MPHIWLKIFQKTLHRLFINSDICYQINYFDVLKYIEINLKRFIIGSKAWGNKSNNNKKDITMRFSVEQYMSFDLFPLGVDMGGFTWENSHRREFHTGLTFWFCIPFTWWLGHFRSCYLKVHFMSIKHTCDSKSQTLSMHYPFQSTRRPISYQNVLLFCIYMIPLRDFRPEWNFCPGTITRVNSRWGDSRRYDILYWYHLNKCRAMRGNWSELTPVRKLPECHVNTP